MDVIRHPPNVTHSKNAPRKYPTAKLDPDIQKDPEDGGGRDLKGPEPQREPM